MQRLPRRWVRAAAPGLAAVLVSASVISPLAGSAVSAAAPGGWSDTSLHVVGGPVQAGAELAVLNVTSGTHRLRLSAISPQDGHVLWSEPSSPSYITAGVAYSPVSVGPIVLNLSPAGVPSDPDVRVQGLDAATGEVTWTVPGEGAVTDAPVICGDGEDFCVDAATNTGAGYLLVLNGATGHIAAIVRRAERDMSPAQPGLYSLGSLWELDNTSPTLAQLSSGNKLLWRRTVPQLFGGRPYNPNGGWDFVTKDGLDVGSVGYQPSGDRVALDQYKTVGVSVATGKVDWRVAGDYECGGLLWFLSVDVVCDYSGTLVERPGGTATSSGLGLTLRGLDVHLGQTTWARKVALSSKAMGTGLQVFLDGTHLVVNSAGGELSVLNALNGTVQPTAVGQVFWCQQIPSYKVDAPTGSTYGGQRTGQTEFSTCSADGVSVAGAPTAQPSTVGLSTDGLFVWLTPLGLRAVPAL